MTKIDAVVPGRSLTLDLCAELAQLRPFGLGNPGVTLLVAGCEVTEAATVGDGKHLRFRIAGHHGLEIDVRIDDARHLSCYIQPEGLAQVEFHMQASQAVAAHDQWFAQRYGYSGVG